MTKTTTIAHEIRPEYGGMTFREEVLDWILESTRALRQTMKDQMSGLASASRVAEVQNQIAELQSRLVQLEKRTAAHDQRHDAARRHLANLEQKIAEVSRQAGGSSQ